MQYAAATAPAVLVEVFSQFFDTSNSTSGPLSQAISQVMDGERILWVTCTGEGPGGGLAILCGLAAALELPSAGVDVITFGTPWQGFNPQFAYIFDRLISQYYLWPFDTTTQPPPPIVLNAPELRSSVQQLAQGGEFIVLSNKTEYLLLHKSAVKNRESCVGIHTCPVYACEIK